MQVGGTGVSLESAVSSARISRASAPRPARPYAQPRTALGSGVPPVRSTHCLSTAIACGYGRIAHNPGQASGACALKAGEAQDAEQGSKRQHKRAHAAPPMSHRRWVRSVQEGRRRAQGRPERLDPPGLGLLRRLRGPYLHRARESPGILREKIEDDPRNIVWLDLPGVLRSRRVAVEVRGHAPRHEVAHLDSVVADLLHERLAHSVQPELRGVVGRRRREGVLPGEARDVDDVASSPVPHPGDRRARAERDPGQVGLDHAVPLLERHLFQVLEETHAGVVDEDVDASERALGLLEEGRHVALAAHIAPAREHALRVLLLQLLPRRGHFLLVPGGDRDPRAGSQQPLRDRAPDPLGAARHDGRLLPDASVHRTSSSASLSSASLPVKKWSAPFTIFSVTGPNRLHCSTYRSRVSGLPYWSRSPCTIARGQGSRSRKSNAWFSTGTPSAMKRSMLD